MLHVGSLFSGIGGIELGLERAGGFKTIWFVENDLYCQFILRKHWADATIYGDIKTIEWDKVERVDVLTGGFPCQDISNAGKRKGIKGERSGLWKEYLKAISILRPKYVIIENVAALLNRGMDAVLCDLASVGYDAEWHCIPAASVGAPHKRDRVFILAHSHGHGEMVKRRDYNNSEWNSQEKIQEWKDVKPRLDIPGDVQADVADTESEGLQRLEHKKRFLARCSERNKQDYWSAEPNVGRVANGVPFRVDRIKCLGNAVVPQCAGFVGKIIKEKEGIQT